MTDSPNVWNFAPSFALPLAADARLCLTDYVNDQSWELYPGTQESPALALQTRYGGRCGLASLVPMWQHEQRILYEARAYAVPPVLTHFLPSLAQLTARILPGLALVADYWVMESHAVGARYTLTNTESVPVSLQLDIFGHVVTEGRTVRQSILTLQSGLHVLAMGKLADLEPVVLLENGRAAIAEGKTSPKVGTSITIAPGATLTVRWVHAGLGTLTESLDRAQFWLTQDWDAAFDIQHQAAAAVPQITVGDPRHDTAIAYSYHKLMQAFLRPAAPADKLPHASITAVREPNRGWSQRGDGTDADRAWNGQPPHLTYLLALAVAPVAPAFAHGLVQNYLAVQSEDGSIDFKPGLAGQRTGALCPPLLARLAWQVYTYTQDQAFLRAVYPGLSAFVERWFRADVDRNQNGLPEWQDERQTGYTAWPTFAAGQSWSQGLDIRSVEGPDLAAYLLSELHSLRAIGQTLAVEEPAFLQPKMSHLAAHLDQLWWTEAGRFAYRERDTGQRSKGDILLKDARGDEELLPVLKLSPPSRLIIRLSGGTGRPPRAALYLEGLDSAGRSIQETIAPEAFTWTYSSGTVTSQQQYAQIDRIRFTGLSRVYRVSAASADHTRMDINALLPIMINTADVQRRAFPALTDTAQFWRPSGISLVSAADPAYDPSSANGGGGVWPFFVTLIGEALMERGDTLAANALAQQMIAAQAQALQEQDHFSEFYHADQSRGIGEADHIGGIVPLHLLLRVLGIVIRSPHEVEIRGRFAWNAPVTFRQHGILVERSATQSRVTFPSGHTVTVPNDDSTHHLTDGGGPSDTPHAVLPLPPNLAEHEGANRVIIKVQGDTETS